MEVEDSRGIVHALVRKAAVLPQELLRPLGQLVALQRPAERLGGDRGSGISSSDSKPPPPSPPH
eukprot:6427276-Pyramimonas_sp.AAC.1